jgi:hypothetical protein
MMAIVLPKTANNVDKTNESINTVCVVVEWPLLATVDTQKTVLRMGMKVP